MRLRDGDCPVPSMSLRYVMAQRRRVTGTKNMQTFQPPLTALRGRSATARLDACDRLPLITGERVT